MSDKCPNKWHLMHLHCHERTVQCRPPLRAELACRWHQNAVQAFVVLATGTRFWELSQMLQNATYKQGRVVPALRLFLSLVDKRLARQRANENNREWRSGGSIWIWIGQTEPDLPRWSCQLPARPTSWWTTASSGSPARLSPCLGSPRSNGRLSPSAPSSGTESSWALKTARRSTPGIPGSCTLHCINNNNTYAASCPSPASHWTNNDLLDQGHYEAGQLPVSFLPVGWPG